MSNNIKADLALFNELVTVFLDDEAQNPVAKYTHPITIAKELDVKLTSEGMAYSHPRELISEVLC